MEHKTKKTVVFSLSIAFMMLFVTTMIGYTNDLISDKDFRNIHWKMTRSETMLSEEEVILEPILAYPEYLISADLVEVAGYRARLFYKFDKHDRLIEGSYLFHIKHTSNNLHIVDFEYLKFLLTEKYGSPLFSEDIWKSDLLKDYPDDWGLAVSIGDVSFVTEWITPTTRITLLLRGDNYEISHSLWYRDITAERVIDTKGL